MATSSPILRRALGTLILCLCSFLPVIRLVAATDKSWSIQVIEDILDRIEPDQERVRLGCTIMRVPTLRALRDRLVQSESEGPEAWAAVPNPINLWTGGIVFYSFDANVSAHHRQHFLDGAAEWATFANVQFVARTAEANYIHVFDAGPGVNGGFSDVGMTGGAQDLGIGSTSWNRGTILHELGHALGFFHEHQRPDRGTFVTILEENIVPGAEFNFVILDAGDVSLLGPYDWYSVMHYARNLLSIDPDTLNTIEPKPGYEQYLNVFGNVTDWLLSAGDRSGLAQVYGNGPALGAVVTNTRDSGPGSLRQCLYYAFDHPNASLSFNIPIADPGYAGGVFTIAPTDRFPSLTNGGVLDGGTQPGGAKIVLNGALTKVTGETPCYGFKIRGSNCALRNAVVNDFAWYGIEISGADSFNNTVTGCYVGTNAAGNAAAVPNAYDGIFVANGAHNNTIGGTVAAQRNVVSGNASAGVAISGAGTQNNTVLGNYLGLDASGTAAVPNGFSGVAIRDGATLNLIGGTTPGAANVISGNTLQGVVIADAGTSQNAVQGNLIGLNAAGTGAVANGWSGVDVFDGASGNTIGGPTAAARNVISGNGNHGIAISGASNSNLVQGNRIGLNPAGTAAIGNGWAGVGMFGGSSLNIVRENVISGNGFQGVVIGNADSNGNIVQNNIIGRDATGTAAVANTWSGIDIFGGAQSNLIGGTTAGAGNLVAGNANHGVLISGTGTTGNLVQGNQLVQNAWAGARLSGGAGGNTIGGTAPGAGNVISGNANQGVAIGNAGTNANTIQGNLIGLTAAGAAPWPNNWSGVDIFDGAQANLIGGTVEEARNYISGNGNYGVLIGGTSTHNNIVQGNRIGVTVGGTAAGNTWTGVHLYGGAQGTSIGGTADGAGNVIAFSGLRGIDVHGAATINNPIRRNSIHHNGNAGFNLGIDLGVDYLTANDAGDGDSGPNGLQNRPVLTSATLTATTNVAGSLNSAPNATYRVEFFASPIGDTSGSGEGQFFLGATDVTTNGSGNATINGALTPVVPAGYVITATATDPAGNTSEFAGNVTVTSADTDGDGMPNSYENSIPGLNASVNDAAADLDGDGNSNLAEFKAGTLPNSAASRFFITSVQPGGGVVEVSFGTVVGRIYRLEYRDDLIAGSWLLLRDLISGTGGTIQVDDRHTTAPRRFYRLSVLP